MPGARESMPNWALPVDFRMPRGRLQVNFLPIEGKLFRENHRQSREDSLAHLRLSEHERDAIVRRDAHPSVKRIGSPFLLILGLVGESAGSQVEADDERGATGRTPLQEVAAIYNRSSCHGTPRNRLRERNPDKLHHAAEWALPAISDAAR